MEFHEKLQALRKSRGLTQEELAEASMYPELLFPNGNRDEVIQVSIP